VQDIIFTVSFFVLPKFPLISSIFSSLLLSFLNIYSFFLVLALLIQHLPACFHSGCKFTSEISFEISFFFSNWVYQSAIRAHSWAHPRSSFSTTLSAKGLRSFCSRILHVIFFLLWGIFYWSWLMSVSKSCVTALSVNVIPKSISDYSI